MIAKEVLEELAVYTTSSSTSLNSGYQPAGGTESFVGALASYFTHVLGVTVDPSSIFTGAGAASAIEQLCFSIADPGDSLLVPAPYYPGFDLDVPARFLCIEIF